MVRWRLLKRILTYCSLNRSDGGGQYLFIYSGVDKFNVNVLFNQYLLLANIQAVSVFLLYYFITWTAAEWNPGSSQSWLRQCTVNTLRSKDLWRTQHAVLKEFILLVIWTVFYNGWSFIQVMISNDLPYGLAQNCYYIIELFVFRIS